MKPAELPNLLILDTSTPQAALALATSRGPIVGAEPSPTERHGRALIPAIEQLLGQAGLRVSDLGGFVVGLGPGSYTGLRIGLTAAKTLAYATGKPLAGFDSLEAIAQNAPAEAFAVHVIADAQRGDVYAASFARSTTGEPLIRLGSTCVMAFADWSARRTPGEYVFGPSVAAGRLAEAIPEFVIRPDNPRDNWPSPISMAEFGLAVWRSGHRVDPWFLEPVYLRKSAAEDLWNAQGKR